MSGLCKGSYGYIDLHIPELFVILYFTETDIEDFFT